MRLRPIGAAEAEAYAAEIAAFADAVRNGAPPSPNGGDGLLALALAGAAVKSVAEGWTARIEEILQSRPQPVFLLCWARIAVLPELWNVCFMFGLAGQT